MIDLRSGHPIFRLHSLLPFSENSFLLSSIFSFPFYNDVNCFKQRCYIPFLWDWLFAHGWSTLCWEWVCWDICLRICQLFSKSTQIYKVTLFANWVATFANGLATLGSKNSLAWIWNHWYCLSWNNSKKSVLLQYLERVFSAVYGQPERIFPAKNNLKNFAVRKI